MFSLGDSFKPLACSLLAAWQLGALDELGLLESLVSLLLAMLVLGNLSEFVVVTKGFFDESCFFEFD